METIVLKALNVTLLLLCLNSCQSISGVGDLFVDPRSNDASRDAGESDVPDDHDGDVGSERPDVSLIGDVARDDDAGDVADEDRRADVEASDRDADADWADVEVGTRAREAGSPVGGPPTRCPIPFPPT